MNNEPLFVNHPETLFSDVVHPNALGHDIIAQVISNKIKAEE
jgi:phospholipase/lecithinase/hemolysin